MTRRQDWILALLAIAACSSAGGEAIPASAGAQRGGVQAYALSATSVTLLGRDGATVGVLTVSRPDAVRREIDIEYRDGSRYVTEVSRPVAGRFRAPVLETREGFVLGDPALASFFAAQDLELTVVAEVAAAEAPGQDSVALCQEITWVSACTQCPPESAHPCTYSRIPGGNVAHGWAHCPPLPVHGCVSDDLVAKDRTCFRTGSCSQHALGFQTCGEDAPRACGLRSDDP